MRQALGKGLNGVSQGTLWLAVLLTPIVALAGGLGFQATLGILGLSAALTWAADRTGADYLRDYWPICLLVFAAWGGVSTLWSPHEGKNAALLFGLTIPLLFVPLVFLRLTARGRNALSWAAIGVGLLGVALLLIDSASGFALSFLADPVPPGGDPELRRGNAEMNVGRGQVSYIHLLWPIAGILIVKLKKGWMLAGLCFLGLAASAHFNNLSIIFPTLFIAFGVAAIAWKWPRMGLMLAFFIAIASLAFAPILGGLSGLINEETMRQLPLSWEHRVRMWAYSWELIQQAPWIGHGFDSSRVFDELTFRAPDGRDIMVMSMHPHNVGLQIWLETGLIGVLLAVGFLLALSKAVLKTCLSSTRAFAAAGLIAAIATSGAVTIGLWQHWWWALIILAASLIILIPMEKSAQR